MNSNSGNPVGRRRLLAGGAAAAGTAYVAPQILATSIAGAQTTTCFVYGVGGRGCTADITALEGMDTTTSTALIDAATGTIDRNPCSGDPAGLNSVSLGSEEVAIMVDSNCQILAVAASSDDGTLIGIADTGTGSYNTTNNGFSGGIFRTSFQEIRVESFGDPIDAIAVTVCCTGSP